jgi:hypothetical protein
MFTLASSIAPTYSIAMSSEPTNDRKRKLTEAPKVDSTDGDDQNPKEIQARRVSGTDAFKSTVSYPQKIAPATTLSTSPSIAASAVDTEQEDSMESIGKLVQDLLDSDHATVEAALHDLAVALGQDTKKRDHFVTAGGCFVIVQLVKYCLKKATEKIPACGRVTKVSKIAELKTLFKSLNLIMRLTLYHDGSRVAISSIGGVEVAVKVMETFPNCQHLQMSACAAINNLTFCNIGKKKTLEAGGIEVLLAAFLNSHLISVNVCQNAAYALYNLINGHKENTKLFLSSGGVTALTKVKQNWPDNDIVQNAVRALMIPVLKELYCWTQVK